MAAIHTQPCMFCNESSVVEVTQAEYDAIQSTPYIQDAIPHRSDAFRELLISGTHDSCWNAMFADEDD